MKWKRQHLVTGGIALSLALGGGAYGLHNVYAADANGQAAVEPSQGDQNGKKHIEFKGNGEMGYVKDAADILGLKTADLISELKGGKSLVDVAKEKNISEDSLIAKLTQKHSQKIDDAVKNGKMTQADADTVKKKLADFTKKAVEQKGLPHMERGDREGKGFFGVKPDQVAGALGITKEELQKELKTGKSLAEIAQARNITKDQLIAKLKDAITPSLEKFVDRKGGVKQGEFHKQGVKGHKPAASPSPSPAAQG